MCYASRAAIFPLPSGPRAPAPATRISFASATPSEKAAIVQSPGIGISPIADMDAHQTASAPRW